MYDDNGSGEAGKRGVQCWLRFLSWSCGGELVLWCCNVVLVLWCGVAEWFWESQWKKPRPRGRNKISAAKPRDWSPDTARGIARGIVWPPDRCGRWTMLKTWFLSPTDIWWHFDIISQKLSHHVMAWWSVWPTWERFESLDHILNGQIRTYRCCIIFCHHGYQRCDCSLKYLINHWNQNLSLIW